MKYALILAGYALVIWGLWALRRDGSRGRTASANEQQAEIESVVEEFIAAAERARDDLREKTAELDRLIGRADERLERFERLERAAQAQPATLSNVRALPLPPVAALPSQHPLSAVAQAAAAASDDDADEPESAPAEAPTPVVRGRAAAAASYEAHARAGRDLLAAEAIAPADESGTAIEEPGARIREAQAVRLALAAVPTPAGEEHATGKAGEKKGRKKERSRHADVYALADAGRGVTEIARATSLSKGEVQLILDLRKAR